MIRFGTRAAGGALLGVATLVAATVAGATAATASTAHPANTQYYRAEPVCSVVKINHSRCLAERLVRVPKGAANARPMARSMRTAAGPAGGYSPAQLAGAYGIDPTASTTQVVGIVDAYNYPTAYKDLNHFDATYGITPQGHTTENGNSFIRVNQRGEHGNYPKTDGGWAGEASLDIDAVRSMCNNCKIILVEADSNGNWNLAQAVKQAVALGATVVTNSYGGTEDKHHPAIDAAYQQPGVVVTASAGDDGYYDWDYINAKKGKSGGATETPASLPQVIAVGGTSLQLNDDGTRASESVWNQNGKADITGYFSKLPMGATGGGCSKVYTANEWQQATVGYSQAGCNHGRLGNDISADADPYTGFDLYDTTPDQGVTGWQTYGGTSLASPLIAGMWALAGGDQGKTWAAHTLYTNFAAASSNFYDVADGGNGWCGGASTAECASIFPHNEGPNAYFHAHVDCAFKGNSSTQAAHTRACKAATGYDGPSGVGTPIGLAGFVPAP